MGRTRARSRNIPSGGQRQPDFAETSLTDAPDTTGQHVSMTVEGMTWDGTPPEPQGDTDKQGEPEGTGEWRNAGRGEQGVEGGEREVESGTGAGQESEGDSEVDSLSEESADSQGRTGEEKEQRTYWKEVEQKVETSVSAQLEKAHAARHAMYEKQVRDLGVIVDPTSSEGEEEGEVAERRRARRREREVEMEKRRTRKDELYREYQESKRHIASEEGVVRDMRKTYEEQLEDKKTAERVGKILRAKKRAAARKEESRAREARELERRKQAAKQRTQQEEEEREEENRKRKSGKESVGDRRGEQGVQTPAGKKREGVQTRSTSRSSGATPEDQTDVSVVLAAERGLPAEGETFAHFTRLLGRTPTTGAEWDLEVSPEGAEQPLFIRGYKLTLPSQCLQEECMEEALATHELHTERWGVWQIVIWHSAEDEIGLGCVARMRRGGEPQAWTGVIQLPAVPGGFLNISTPEGNEVMRAQIQEVLRKAGAELAEQGTEEEREDLRGVEVISAQQLYVS
eukprot:5382036-Pleurochrysis_carterae.AAC.1